MLAADPVLDRGPEAYCTQQDPPWGLLLERQSRYLHTLSQGMATPRLHSMHSWLQLLPVGPVGANLTMGLFPVAPGALDECLPYTQHRSPMWTEAQAGQDLAVMPERV